MTIAGKRIINGGGDKEFPIVDDMMTDVRDPAEPHHAVGTPSALKVLAQSGRGYTCYTYRGKTVHSALADGFGSCSPPVQRTADL